MVSPRAFTLIELLVVLLIIGLLMALIAPGLGKATDHAQVAFCGSNEHAMGVALSQWLMENKQRFPKIHNFGTLLGNRGTSTQYGSHLYSEKMRPLNPYLGYQSGPVRAARCPSDQGDVLSYERLFDEFRAEEEDEPNVYVPTENTYFGYGSSYQEAYRKSRWGVRPVFGRIGDSRSMSMRLSGITRTDNKVLLGDWPFFGDRRLDSERTRWHDESQRRFNVLFADMHSEFFLFPGGEMEKPQNERREPSPSFFWW